MKTTHIFRALGAVAASAIAGAALHAASQEKPTPRTEVVFFESERFTDVRDTSTDAPQGRDYILRELKTYLQERAQDYVPEGAKLSVTVTDIDLAGEFEPWRVGSAADVRIVKEIYPPRIKLSFRLTDAAGDVVKQGERELTNPNFLMMALPTMVNDPYRHEKALIDDWLSREFTRPKKS
ncbi:MAG: DUF3016 domain-containing protein [Opitutaceae bacterium]